MKCLSFLAVSWFLMNMTNSQAHAAPFNLKSSAIQAHNSPFISHVGSGLYSNYLAVNLPYKPFAELRDSVAFNLKNRGEAHITVLTPPEYNAIKSHLPITRINQMFAHSIQNTKYTPKCIGRGQKSINGKLESTYYVVVESKDLMAIRHKIKNEFVALGGSSDAFDPMKYHPHVTLGFTLRDLHSQDSVVKGMSSCIKDLVTTS